MPGISAKLLLVSPAPGCCLSKEFGSIYIHLFATQDVPVAHVSHVCTGKTINCVTTQRYLPVRVGI